MANQTIYPYGTGGQLPSSIGIINDLTTGGADKALSAEMGKELNDRLEELETSGGGLSAAFVGDTLVITNSEDLAYIKVSKSSVSFPQTEENDTSTKTIVVTGRNLTSGITLVLSGTDAAMFSLSTNSIAAADANSQNSITVTYAPTAVGSHSASITLISGDVMNSLSISGTCVEEIVPSILINLGESILLAAEEGETSTQTVPITAENLTPFAVVAISNEGSEFSVSPASITADEDGTIDSTITVEYTAGSADSTDTITASCTDATATAAVEGSVRTRLAQDSYWTDNSGLKYTVQTNTKNVSVVAGDSFVEGSSVDLTIPATANDTGMTVYDSGGNVIPASGLTYNVKSIGMRATATGGFEGKSLHDVIVSEGITSIGARAFFGSSSSVYALNSIVLPSTLTSWGTVSNASWALRQRNVKKVVINGSSGWAPYITNSTALEWLEFGQNVANCSGNNAEWMVKSGGKIVIRKTGSKLALTSSFFSSATYGNATVYVPDDLLSTYQADSAWGAFTTIKGLSELTE